jgi:hypothetical protein
LITLEKHLNQQEEKDKEWKQVAEEHKVDFETDNSTDLRHPDP